MIDPQIPIRLGEELDRLRTENTEQRRLLDEARQLVLDAQTHALTFISAENENATLRELVREAKHPMLRMGFAAWHQRAEKALATGPSRPPEA